MEYTEQKFQRIDQLQKRDIKLLFILAWILFILLSLNIISSEIQHLNSDQILHKKEIPGASTPGIEHK